MIAAIIVLFGKDDSSAAQTGKRLMRGLVRLTEKTKDEIEMKTTTLALILAIALAACVPPAAIPTDTPTPVGAPTPDPLSTGALVEVNVGDYSLYAHCFGTGSPVVVMDNALGADWSYWYTVYSQLPSTLRVCMYDRSADAHTSQKMVEDLHALLTGARLEAPYVLVGHSFGGVNMILFASRYPEQVAGVVLEDSSHPDQGSRGLAALPPESLNESSDLANLRKQFTQWTSPGNYFASIDVAASFDQVCTVKSLGDVPLVVLTHSPNNFNWGNIPADVSAKLEQASQDMQKELAALSSNSEHIIANTSNHTIHQSEPQLVVNAILKLVNAARSK
jgi:pimeloyl-ACP methyl ester carboxylesterase